mmetsp:Transcript_44671/g.93488  ORF Transcript_44671/g.93488 Transcript_44671/m.93488 type:complete len:130 (+) Transcript_44671:1209-1598(+)
MLLRRKPPPPREAKFPTLKWPWQVWLQEIMRLRRRPRTDTSVSTGRGLVTTTQESTKGIQDCRRVFLRMCSFYQKELGSAIRLQRNAVRDCLWGVGWNCYCIRQRTECPIEWLVHAGIKLAFNEHVLIS